MDKNNDLDEPSSLREHKDGIEIEMEMETQQEKAPLTTMNIDDELKDLASKIKITPSSLKEKNVLIVVDQFSESLDVALLVNVLGQFDEIGTFIASPLHNNKQGKNKQQQQISPSWTVQLTGNVSIFPHMTLSQALTKERQPPHENQHSVESHPLSQPKLNHIDGDEDGNAEVKQQEQLQQEKEKNSKMDHIAKSPWDVMVLPGGNRAVNRLMENSTFTRLLEQQKQKLVVALGAFALALDSVALGHAHYPVKSPTIVSTATTTKSTLNAPKLATFNTTMMTPILVRNEPRHGSPHPYFLWQSPGLGTCTEVALAIGEYLLGTPAAIKVAKQLGVWPEPSSRPSWKIKRHDNRSNNCKQNNESNDHLNESTNTGKSQQNEKATEKEQEKEITPPPPEQTEGQGLDATLPPNFVFTPSLTLTAPNSNSRKRRRGSGSSAMANECKLDEDERFAFRQVLWPSLTERCWKAVNDKGRKYVPPMTLFSPDQDPCVFRTPLQVVEYLESDFDNWQALLMPYYQKFYESQQADVKQKKPRMAKRKPSLQPTTPKASTPAPDYAAATPTPTTKWKDLLLNYYDQVQGSQQSDRGPQKRRLRGQQTPTRKKEDVTSNSTAQSPITDRVPQKKRLRRKQTPSPATAAKPPPPTIRKKEEVTPNSTAESPIAPAIEQKKADYLSSPTSNAFLAKPVVVDPIFDAIVWKRLEQLNCGWYRPIHRKRLVFARGDEQMWMHPDQVIQYLIRQGRQERKAEFLQVVDLYLHCKRTASSSYEQQSTSKIPSTSVVELERETKRQMPALKFY